MRARVCVCVLQQTRSYLLENVHVVLGKACEDDVRSDVIPLVVSGLDTEWTPCQSAAIAAISVMHKFMDSNMMRRHVLPPVKTLFTQSTSVHVGYITRSLL